jgi:hypothetical protein
MLKNPISASTTPKGSTNIMMIPTINIMNEDIPIITVNVSLVSSLLMISIVLEYNHSK